MAWNPALPHWKLKVWELMAHCSYYHHSGSLSSPSLKHTCTLIYYNNCNNLKIDFRWTLDSDSVFLLIKPHHHNSRMLWWLSMQLSSGWFLLGLLVWYFGPSFFKSVFFYYLFYCQPDENLKHINAWSCWSFTSCSKTSEKHSYIMSEVTVSSAFNFGFPLD